MKIALLFPGYGSQFVGMGKELYDEHRIIQEYFEEASRCLDINFIKLCFASSDTELSKIHHAYTATFLVSSSIMKLLQEQGIKPDVLVGYNQGEFSAIFAGGGVSLPDGLYLLNKYASFYESALADLDVSAIRITGLSAKKVEDICNKVSMPDAKASIALYESDSSCIVTGDTQAVDLVRTKASKFSEKQVIDIEPVGVEIELHSSLMNPVVEQFRMYLEKVDFKDLMIPMIETVGVTKIEQGNRVREQIIKRSTCAVDWPKIEQALESYDVIVEVGPGTLLSDRVRKRYPEKKILAINKQADIDQLKQLVGMTTPKEAASADSDNKEKKLESISKETGSIKKQE